MSDLAHIHGIRGSRDQNSSAEILQKHSLLFGVARADGNNGASDFLKTVVQSQSTGEKTVSERNLSHVVVCNSDSGAKPCHAVAPVAEVVSGISDYSGLARRTA